MQMLTLSANQFLDDYVLGVEFAKKAKISTNAYRYWKRAIAAKYEGSRTVFLLKRSIPQKYQPIVEECQNLNGLVQSSAFCTYTGLASSHLIQSNGSNIYDKLRILSIECVKLVDLKQFYDDLELPYHYNIYIEKCHFFSPTPLEKKIKLTDTLCVGYY